MSSSEPVPDPLAERLSLIRPHLDQRAWRLLLGAEAKVLGRGGIKTVAAATRAHPDTVAQGVRELDYPEPIPGRIRRPGAGRKSAAATDPDIGRRVGRPGRSGDPWGPGIGVAVDDEIDAEAGRGIDRAGSQGVGDNGREAAERVRVQPAGERESR